MMKIKWKIKIEIEGVTRHMDVAVLDVPTDRVSEGMTEEQIAYAVQDFLEEAQALCITSSWEGISGGGKES